MQSSPLVHYATEAEYRQHYEREYCRSVVTTFDGIRVYFSPSKFLHAFYESTNRDGQKDSFSPVRAQRIDWIKATLESPQADIYKGYDKNKGLYDDTRRVAVVYEDFVVIISLSLKRDGTLKGNFVTCYQADNSIGKIRTSPYWSRETCRRKLEALRAKKNR